MEEFKGCVMADVIKPSTFDNIKLIIDPNDLAEDGFEEETHLTLIFGLKNDVSSKEVKKVLTPFKLKEIYVNGLSLFENDDADVLKLDVDLTDNLIDIHNALITLPNKQSYPNYEPHITIAYLKPGTGKKYLGKLKFWIPMKIDKIVYSVDFSDKKVIKETIIKNKRIL